MCTVIISTYLSGQKWNSGGELYDGTGITATLVGKTLVRSTFGFDDQGVVYSLLRVSSTSIPWEVTITISATLDSVT